MTIHYSERQRFRQDWLWALLIAASGPSALLAIVAIAAEGGRSTRNLVLWSGVVVALVFGPLVVLYYASLSVAVRDDGLTLRLWPLHLRERVVPPEDVSGVSVEEVDALGDFGGVGLRLNPTVYRWGVRFDGPVGYVVRGDRGVRIERRSGRDLVVTSTDPSTLAGSLRRICRYTDRRDG